MRLLAFFTFCAANRCYSDPMVKLAGLIALVCLVAGSAVFVVRSAQRREAVKQRARVLKQAITPKPLVPTEPANPQHKLECEQALNSANHGGTVLKNWRAYGAHVNVRVHGSYYHTNLTHKRTLDKALRCVVSEGRETDQGLKQVTYRNAKNDQLVALWERSSGFKMAD